MQVLVVCGLKLCMDRVCEEGPGRNGQGGLWPLGSDTAGVGQALMPATFDAGHLQEAIPQRPAAELLGMLYRTCSMMRAA